MSITRKVFGRAGASLAAIMVMAPMLAACGGTPATNTVVPATVAPTAMAVAETPTTMMAGQTPTAMMAGETPTAMMAGTTPTAMMAGETPTAMMAGQTPGAMMTPGGSGGMMQAMTISMKAQNGSGQDGTAMISEKGVLTLDLKNGTTEPQPAHIHKGTCAALGDVVVPLTNVVGGKSDTTIPASFTMEAGQTYAINVHKSAAEVKVYTSCGDITSGGMTGTPGPMMTPGAGGAKIKVGLVTDVGKVNDGTFNQFAYDGLQRGKTELGVDTNYLETAASADYDKNMEQFASQNYDMVIAVGFLMGDALKANAAKHPNTKYAIVDYAYSPALPNVRGLVFAEDQAGYLAGALAASMSKNNVIGVVGGIEGVPAVKRYVLGYTNGAKSIKPDIQVKFIYIDSFSDRARGAEAAKDFMNQGADVIFGAGGQTGSGAIQAAAQAGAWVIGVDQDEYLTTFQNGAAAGADKIISSATKRVDNAVFSAIKDAQAGTLKGGTQLYDAASQGVGLAPFHKADSSIPAEVKSKLDTILKGLADGSLKTGVTLP